jgi:hypothetical protein
MKEKFNIRERVILKKENRYYKTCIINSVFIVEYGCVLYRIKLGDALVREHELIKYTGQKEINGIRVICY